MSHTPQAHTVIIATVPPVNEAPTLYRLNADSDGESIIQFKSNDTPGCCNIDLLRVVYDRLMHVQAGTGANLENHAALMAVASAASALKACEENAAPTAGKCSRIPGFDTKFVVREFADALCWGPIMFYRRKSAAFLIEPYQQAIDSGKVGEFNFDPQDCVILAEAADASVDAQWVVDRDVFERTYRATGNPGEYRKHTVGIAVQVPLEFAGRVETMEGPVSFDPYDWIAVGTNGEVWPINQMTFALNMEFLPHTLTLLDDQDEATRARVAKALVHNAAMHGTPLPIDGISTDMSHDEIAGLLLGAKA